MSPNQTMTRFRSDFYAVAALALAVASPFCVGAQSSAGRLAGRDALRQGFEDPPEVARPRVWWHWMNGNITREGIRLDLEWMHRVGLGGFQTFDASFLTPQVVDKRLVYMTPEWRDAFKYATTLADRLGLEESIAGSPGWSETGGPWVPAKEAMKKYVWSETRVEGGKPFHGVLPHPPSTTGAFQNLPVEDAGAALGGAFQGPEFYADSVVLGYRAADTDVTLASLHPSITSSSKIDASLLTDGDLTKATSLALPGQIGEKAWVQFEFPQPQAIRGITIVAGKKNAMDSLVEAHGNSGRALETSDDGQNYRVVAEIPLGGATEHTLSFVPVTAKYFRVTFTTLLPPPNPYDMGAGPAKPPTEVPVAELVLHPGARVNRFEEKAAFKQLADLYPLATPDFGQGDVIKKNGVIDLTGKMHPDGTLDWDPPVGEWIVVRFGYSLLGISNHPATKEATGLEVDKLNAHYVKNYMDAYLARYKNTVGAGMMGKRGIRYMITDSWEAGAQNWTDDMIGEFTKRRGYDPHPWLPVLTGRIVESAQASDRFLWDFRKTIADLTTDEHYRQVQASLKERGIGHYGESQEDNRAFIADGMEVKKLADIPMGAMWVQKPGVNKVNYNYNYNADDRESASVAHIYGQNIAAAESLTSCDSSTAYAWSPATLKPTADQEFLNGINRIVIHESAHQPLTGKVPGVTLGVCGQWFNRNETWAEQANVWVKYLARNSWMLQQGKFAADVLYFYGEDSNITAIFHDSAPDVPVGYDFDYINADGLIHAVSVSNGKLTTKSGMNYRALVLDKYSRHMSLPVLRAIQALVKQGAIVAGEKPIETPSLADEAADFKRIDDELFGQGSGVQSIGRGKIYSGRNAETVLKALNVTRDFDYSKLDSDQQVLFVHRKLTDGDLYFLDNRGDRDATIDATFRVSGKVPELWYPETGKIAAASFTMADGHTTVPLHFEPWGSLFVVFRRPTNEKSRILPRITDRPLMSISGPWNVSFQPGRGAPASATFDKLISWPESPDRGIKYFSGSATYTRMVQGTPDWFGKDAKLWIDLGDVKNLAVVTVNGKELGTLWHAPYRIDATSALKPTANTISVTVINSWVNRLVGDLQPNVTAKYTFTTWKSYRADSPLLSSGLIGPVTIDMETSK